MSARATIVGSGPNGLAAAVTLARAGYRVRVQEAARSIGGGVRTLPGPLPGFRHDVGSAVHPAALGSPFFRAFGLPARVAWITPEAAFAHPLEDGAAAIAWHDLDRTIADLGRDGAAWRRIVRPLNRHRDEVFATVGDQLLRVPRHPVVAARFGLRALQLGVPAGRAMLRTAAGGALWTGVAAHANTVLPSVPAAGAALLLLAHAHTQPGWAFPRGGAQAIADALVADLVAHGGTIETGVRVRALPELDWGDPRRGDLLLLDTSPRLLATHPDLPASYAHAVRGYRYGPAAAKVDFALAAPVPWANPLVARSATVHLGGTRAEIEAAEAEVAAGRVPARPYVLAAQPSLFDPTRAPAGRHVLWTYTHVPARSPVDPTAQITAQIERFAPGFRDVVLAASVTTAAHRRDRNPAEIDGDILGGSLSLVQTVRRPVVSRTPWRTPLPGVYLASASTPPGPGVTGMPGWLAARRALHDAGLRVELADLFG